MKQLSFSRFFPWNSLPIVSLIILLSGCGAHTSTTNTTTTGDEVVATPLSASTPEPPNFGEFVGTWASHATVLTFAADGHAQFMARTYQWCSATVPPPCDSIQGNTIVFGVREDMLFTRVAGSIAYGTLTASTSGNVGDAVKVILAPDDTITFDDSSSVVPRTLCGPGAPGGTCGA